MAARHGIWVDSDPNVAKSATLFMNAGLKMHFYNETADALEGFRKQYPVDDQLVLIVTSMMRRGGRQERGLLDGLQMLDDLRFKLQITGETSCRPMLAVISMTADKQECIDHAVDILVKDARRQFQMQVLAVLDEESDRSWRTKWRFNTIPQNCEHLYAGAGLLQSELCREFKGALEELFESGTNHCFCEVCESQKAWTRGGHKYILPIGWYRLGLSLRPEFLFRRSEIEQWPIAYHGTSRGNLLSIIKHRRIMFPGDTLLDGTTLPIVHGQCWADRLGGGPVIYTSPSVLYAGSPLYAKPFDLNGKKAQVVFQVRVNPKAIYKFPETLHGKFSDSDFQSSELEWVTKDKSAVVPYGLLSRFLPQA